jgi:iron complex outermembrane receptor protein
MTLITVAHVNAQESIPIVGPAEQAANISQPGEIIVTARRVAESAQRVPLSITVLSAADLKSQRIFAVQDLQFSSPALTLSSSLSRSNISYSMRGQAQTFGGALPGVQPYFNEVPLPNGTFQLFDVASVQVLKGPQGTLFGRSTTGGAVLFTSVKPDNKLGGYGQVSLGNLNFYDIQGAINIPILADKISLRIAADSVRRDGFTRDLTHARDLDDQAIDSWRVSLRLQPVDTIDSIFVYDGVRVDQHGAAPILSGYISGLASTFPGFVAAATAQQTLGVRQRNVDANLFDYRFNWGIQNTTSWRISDNVTLKNIVNYRRIKVRTAYDQDGTALPIAQTTSDYGGYYQTDNHLFTEEAQALGKLFNNRVDWILGFYAERTKSDGPEASTSRLLGSIYRSTITYQNDSTRAVFGQASVRLSEIAEGLKATAGFRYNWDQRFVTSQVVNLASGTPVFVAPLAGSARFRAPSWTFGLDWQVSDKLLLYFVNRRGYKSGGFNKLATSTTTPSLFRPETVSDFEIGAKQTFNTGGVKGHVDIALYTGNYRDIQRSLVATAATTETINAASARIRGFEIEAAISPAAFLELSGYWSLVDAKYNNFVNPFNGRNLSSSVFAYTPRSKLSGTARIQFGEVGGAGNLSAAATIYRQSSVAYSDENLDFGPAFGAAYTIYNASMDLRHVAGLPIDLGLFVKNLTDKKYVTAGGLINPSIYGLATIFYGEPRTFGGQASVHF